jgi:hypothetical protein
MPKNMNIIPISTLIPDKVTNRPNKNTPKDDKSRTLSSPMNDITRSTKNVKLNIIILGRVLAITNIVNHTPSLKTYL